MSEHGVFLWQRATLPDVNEVVRVCRQYGVKRVAVKVLDGTARYNVQGGDAGLKAYLQALRDGGLTVEGWGYHYPANPGAQGDAIEERRDKLGFDRYHLDIEGEWGSLPYGAPAAMKLLLSKLKTRGFELLVCSFRFPSLVPGVPWDAMAYHENVDGWSPQVYWALAHNPVEQLERCLAEYNKLPVWKPVFPVGPIHGGVYSKVYWEPTVEEVEAFREACETIPVVYWYSLDWVMADKRLDLLEAATGVNNGVVVPPPVPGVKRIELSVVPLNCRVGPGTSSAVAGTFQRWEAGLPFEVLESAMVGGKPWYRIADKRWVAGWLVKEVN